jgi:glutaminase
VADRLRELHARYAGLDAGEVATYIPELAKADPCAFGICVVTLDGHAYEVGDATVPFTIQSVRSRSCTTQRSPLTRRGRLGSWRGRAGIAAARLRRR